MGMKAAQRRTPKRPPQELTRASLRAAVTELLQVAVLWESGSLQAGRTKAAKAARSHHESLLSWFVADMDGHWDSTPVGHEKATVLQMGDPKLLILRKNFESILAIYLSRLKELAGDGLPDDTKSSITRDTPQQGAMTSILTICRACGVTITLDDVVYAWADLSKGVAPGSNWVKKFRGKNIASYQLMNALFGRSETTLRSSQRGIGAQFTVEGTGPKAVEMATHGALLDSPDDIRWYALSLIGCSDALIEEVLARLNETPAERALAMRKLRASLDHSKHMDEDIE